MKSDTQYAQKLKVLDFLLPNSMVINEIVECKC